MNPLKLSNLSMLLLIGQLIFANTQDRAQILHVLADSATLNQNTHMHTFQGHVKMNQGTTEVKGHTLILMTNPKNIVLESIVLGDLASFQTLPNHSNSHFNAEASLIHYYPPQHRVLLKGEATAYLNADTYAGPFIEYNTQTQVVVSPRSSKGRTHIVIHPHTSK